MNYRNFANQQMLESIYDKMSEEEKRAFLQMSLQNKNHDELMSVLRMQGVQIADLRQHQSWLSDFSANIAANAVFDGVVWIGSRLFRQIR